jgi:hypothetical protein
MRKIFTLLTVITLNSIILKAQSPQGINYQAVAYNNLSQPVTNQTVGVRLSVLDGGAAGAVLYSETQAPNTDNTGLFSIVIGNGTPVSGTFAGINWAAGTRWLKTEIDIAGGNNYVVMGSSQFMSVPYALYAEKAGTADKINFTSGSFQIPDGFKTVTTVLIPANTNYTVPAGKNLYIPNSVGGIAIDGDTLWPSLTSAAADSRTMAGASEGSIITAPSIKPAFLVDKTVNWVSFNFKSTPYTVPAGKQLVVINQSFYYHDYNNPGNINCKPALNGTPLDGYGGNITNSILDENSVLSAIGCPASVGYTYNINGYLKDK